MVAGRPLDPDVADEATINEEMADHFGLGVGDRLALTPYRRDEFDVAGEGVDPPTGVAMDVEIVGIVRRPVDMRSRAASGDESEFGGRIEVGPAVEHLDGDVASYTTGVLFTLADGAQPDDVAQAIDALMACTGCTRSAPDPRTTAAGTHRSPTRSTPRPPGSG